jgi:quercetin dioxygenase-like cupin family protein
MNRGFALCLTFGALLGGVGSMAASADQTIQIVDADKLAWQDYPGLPGVTFVVLAGNPREPGLYVIRARFAPHTMSRPHWHPEARYVTVVKGTWWAGTGDKLDPDSTTPIHAGGFAIHAPREVHFDGAKEEEAIVQISGMGPSGTFVVAPGEPKQQ